MTTYPHEADEVDEKLSTLLIDTISRNAEPEKALAELSEREATLFDAFLEVCRSRRNEDNQDEAPNPYALANKCDISLAKLSKCSSMCAALWTAYFSFFAKDLVLGMGKKLKYDSLETFLNAYEPHFVDPMHYGEKEQISLCHMANFCSVVLKFMSAKGSKQLFMKLAPRLLEGWDVKYICGSGQSRATADRVLIYEKEGAVKPLRRAPRRNFVEEPQGHQHSSTAHSAKKIRTTVVEEVETTEFIGFDPGLDFTESESCDDFWGEPYDLSLL